MNLARSMFKNGSKHWRRASKLTSCRFRCSENAIFGKNGFRKHIPETHSKLFYICGLLTSSIRSSCWSISWVFQVPAANPSQVQFCGVSTAKPTHICWVATSIGLLSADVLRVVLARKTSNHPKFDPTPGHLGSTNSIPLQHLHNVASRASLKLLQHLHNVACRSITSFRQPTWTLLAHPTPPTPPHLKLLQHLNDVAWRSITSFRQPTWTLLAHPIPHPTPPHPMLWRSDWNRTNIPKNQTFTSNQHENIKTNSRSHGKIYNSAVAWEAPSPITNLPI